MTVANIGRDVAIPAYFIRHHLALLSAAAVHLYLQLCLKGAEGCTLSGELLSELQVPDPSEALAELCREGLVLLKEQGRLELVNLNLEEARAYLEQESDKSAAADHTLHETLVRSIADTFYQGTMPRTFYSFIDQCLDQYHFQPELLYALFQEGKAYRQLGSRNYLESIANRWRLEGIQTFEQLEKRLERRREELSFEQEILQKLGIRARRLSEAEQDLLQKWQDDWQLSEAMIHLALSKSTSFQNPTFSALDRILGEWHAAALSTPEDVQQWEQKRRQQRREKQGAVRQDLRRQTTPTSGADADMERLLQRILPEEH